MSLAFLPWAAALSLTLGTPALVRSFLLPTASTRPEDRRPRKPLFFATWLVTVLPIWAIAPFSWAALSEALYASWRLGESVWSGRSTLGKVWLVWASIEVRRIAPVPPCELLASKNALGGGVVRSRPGSPTQRANR
jgi:hypothetical protein